MIFPSSLRRRISVLGRTIKSSTGSTQRFGRCPKSLMMMFMKIGCSLMKAIIVIDVVDDDITKYYADIFKEGGKNDEMVGRFYRFKPMAEKNGLVHQDVDGWCKLSEYSRGWNACLEEIEK